MTQTVLILGASGRFGRHAATAFRAAGWTVRGFDRAKDTLPEAAQGVDVIIAAWNPAYPDWAVQVPQLHAQVIEAAKVVDATVIVPGNVYVYGANTPNPWTLTSPHAATNPLGVIRRDMEAAYRDSGVRTILLRAGDFIDTQASGNWFDQIMVPKTAKGRFTYPGTPDIPHAWAFLPDLGQAAVMLAERRDHLNRFEEVLFPGYTLSGHQMANAIASALNRPIQLKPMNWLPLRLLAPVWKMGRCLVEMRYLWNTPHSLDGARFDALLPEFQPTPLHDALAQALPRGAEQASPYGGTNRSTQISA